MFTTPINMKQNDLTSKERVVYDFVITNSTLLFSFRPSFVALEVKGVSLPKPLYKMRLSCTPNVKR